MPATAVEEATEIRPDSMTVVKVTARRQVADALDALGVRWREIDHAATTAIIQAEMRAIADELDEYARWGDLPRCQSLEELAVRLSACATAAKKLETFMVEAVA